MNYKEMMEYFNGSTKPEDLKKYSRYKSQKDDEKELDELKMNIFRKLINSTDKVQAAYIFNQNRLIERRREEVEDIEARLENAIDQYRSSDIYAGDDRTELENERAQLEADINSASLAVDNPALSLAGKLQSKLSEKTLYGNVSFNMTSGMFNPGSNVLVDYEDQIKSLDVNDMLEFYGDFLKEEDFNEILEDIESPKLSNEYKEYLNKGESAFSITRGLTDDPQNENDRNVSRIFNRDAEELKLYLGDVNPESEEYKNKIEDLVYLNAYSDSTRKFAMPNATLAQRSNPEYASLYIEELLNKGRAFRNDGNKYKTLDFHSIGKNAVSKADLDLNQIKNRVNEARDFGRRYREDKESIEDYLKDIHSNRDFQDKYNSLVKDIISGNVNLYHFGDQKLDFNTNDLSRVCEQVNKLYKDQTGNDVSVYGVRPNDTVNSLSRKTKNIDYLFSEFKNSTEYKMTDEEKELQKESQRYLNSRTVTLEDLDKEHKTAVVKSAGLKCDKNSPLLNDALNFYKQAKAIRESRPWYYGLIHPINNSREKSAINTMETSLRDKFNLSGAELQNRLNALGQDNNYKSIEEMSNLRFNSKEEFDALTLSQEERNKQRYDLIQKSVEKYTKKDNKSKNADLINEIKNDLDLNKTNNSKKTIEEVYNQFIEEKSLDYKVNDSHLIKNEEAFKSDTSMLEEFIDKKGYEKDKNDKTNFLQKEINARINRLKNPSSDDKYKEQGESIENYSKTREVFDKGLELNKEERLNKFFIELSKFKDQKQKEAYENAIGDEKIKLEKEYKENHEKSLEEISNLEKNNKLINQKKLALDSFDVKNIDKKDIKNEIDNVLNNVEEKFNLKENNNIDFYEKLKNDVNPPRDLNQNIMNIENINNKVNEINNNEINVENELS